MRCLGVMGGTSSKQQSLQQPEPKPNLQTKQLVANPPTNPISPVTLHRGVMPPSDVKEGIELLEHSDSERYQKVFKVYYARMCDALPVEEVLPHLVSNDVITIREMDDVLAEKTPFRQARALLNGPIWRAISGGYPQAFITLLLVLHSIRSCEILCEEICTKLNHRLWLNKSTKVMTSESREFKYQL